MTQLTSKDYLEHFGVKGMRWGVRRDRRAQNLVNVGQGKGTATQKLRAYGTTSPLDVVRGRGFKGGARIRGQRQLARNKRIRNGEASVRDRLVYVGGTKYQDIFPTGKSRTNTSAAVGASIAGALVVSVGFQAVGAILKNAG